MNNEQARIVVNAARAYCQGAITEQQAIEEIATVLNVSQDRASEMLADALINVET